MYRPTEPFNATAELFTVTYETVRGVNKKVYTSVGNIFCIFKTYGGTEQTVNGVYSVVDTAQVTTYYRPDIKANCRLIIDGKTYDVIGAPDNISMRNQYLQFKVKAVSGGA